MNRLRGTTAYLSGPVEAHQNPDGWRNKLSGQLDRMGIISYNPLIKPNWMPDVTGPEQAGWKKSFSPDNNELIYKNSIIRQFCLRMTYACDFMILKLEKSIFTVGTYEELAAATVCGKPVLVICDDPIPSMWLIDQIDAYRCLNEHFFKTEDDLVNYLYDINCGEKRPHDPMKWLFLTFKSEDSEE